MWERACSRSFLAAGEQRLAANHGCLHLRRCCAADVVNYECAVSIQAPRTQDYPWLATLLKKRVKKLNPDFDLQIEKQILRTVPAQMVLSPRKP